MKKETTPGYQIIQEWMARQMRQPFSFQKQTWQHYIDHKDGIVVAPTGLGEDVFCLLGSAD